MIRSLIWVGVLFAGVGCATMSEKPSSSDDKFLWLEDVYGDAPLAWVKERNAKTENLLVNDSRYARAAKEARAILTAKDRIPMPSFVGGDKYRNFWQDENHRRGIWRETSVNEYAKANPKWKTLLDIDALNKKEGKSYVLSEIRCLEPEKNLCLLGLSDGGKDATLIREFDISKGEFVVGGFEIPAAKTRVDWLDKDTLLVGTNWGPDSLTTSGYARQVRVWKRGQSLSEAKLIFNGRATDVVVHPRVSWRPESRHVFISNRPTFFEEENYWVTPEMNLVKMPLPSSADFFGDFKNFLIFGLREDLKVGKQSFVAGSVVALPLAALTVSSPLLQLEKIFEPNDVTANNTMYGFTASKDYIYLNILNNVRGEIHRVHRNDNSGQWEFATLPLPRDGSVRVVDVDTFSNQLLVVYDSFLSPTTLYVGSGDDLTKFKKLKSLPHRFKSSDFVTEQFFATSKDGTKVPYFVVRSKKAKFEVANPTLLYGYGGFENAMTPMYLNHIGKVWLEKGGVYVLANIRGGGEFGPRWHRAALKENRQRAYDDFAAIAEDLIARKITSPAKLGIMGGSNGGLLVGVAATQRPELYKAVVCKAPLLDMLRYHKLPPGASWMAEYGNPDIPREAEYIAKYSPYQNVREGVKYPKIYFYGSTADDRVQPGHARKMAARLEEVGAEVVFYENTEGGHGGAADLEQRIKAVALDYTYLYQQLM